MPKSSMTPGAKLTVTPDPLRTPTKASSFMPLWARDFTGRFVGYTAIGLGIGVGASAFAGPAAPAVILLGAGLGAVAGTVAGTATVLFQSSYRRDEADQIRQLNELDQQLEDLQSGEFLRLSEEDKLEIDQTINPFIESLRSKTPEERHQINASLSHDHWLKDKIPQNFSPHAENLLREHMQNHMAIQLANSSRDSRVPTKALPPPEKPSLFERVSNGVNSFFGVSESSYLGMFVAATAVGIGAAVFTGLAAFPLTGLALGAAVVGGAAGYGLVKRNQSIEKKAAARDEEIQRLTNDVGACSRARAKTMGGLEVSLQVMMQETSSSAADKWLQAKQTSPTVASTCSDSLLKATKRREELPNENTSTSSHRGIPRAGA